MIKLFEPYVSVAARANVQRVLSGKQLAEGPEVKAFEAEFAKKFGFEPWQIVSLNSGTSSLELAYQIAGIDSDSTVIAPILTCTATNIPLVRAGAHIVFADIEGRKHLNMDPEDVAYKLEDISNKPHKVVVFIHFGGNSAGLEEIEELCEQHSVDLICDAAQALGSKLSLKARFNCISLQAIKSLTAGDGGILICRDERDAKMARKLRWFGYDRELKQKMGDCDLEYAGYKMHMNDISAAIARGNLENWDIILHHRQHINAVYEDAAAKVSSGPVFVAGIWNPQVIAPMHKFEQLKEKCAARGFEIGQYHYPNSKYSIFKRFHAITPKMDELKDNYFLLPCHFGMSWSDAEMVARTIWP